MIIIRTRTQCVKSIQEKTVVGCPGSVEQFNKDITHDEEVDKGEDAIRGKDDGDRLERCDVGNGDEEVGQSEESNGGEDDGDSLERCDVVDGGSKHTCGRAGKLVQLKKVGHS